MKVRYDESFLFPNSQEDFGRSLVFPQGRLHGLRGLGAVPTDAEIRAAGATFGLDPDDPAQRNLIISEIEKRIRIKAVDDAYALETAARQKAAAESLRFMVADSTGRYTDASISEAQWYINQQLADEEAVTRAAQISAQAAIQDSIIAAQAIPNTIEEIVLRAQSNAAYWANNQGYDYDARKAAVDAAEMSARRGDSLDDQFFYYSQAAAASKSRTDAIADQQAIIAADIAEMKAAAEITFAQQRAAEAIEAEKLAAKQKADFEARIAKQLLIDQANAQAVAAQQAQAQADIAAQAAATRAPRVIVNAGQTVDQAIAAAAAAAAAKTVTTTNNTAGTVTTTNPATGTVTTTNPTTGTTTTANVVTGAVTVTTGSGQTVSGTGAVTAGNTSTTVNQAAGTVTTTNTTTGATTVTNAATGQSQTGTAPPTTYILDFYDNQFWLKTSAGAAVSNGSADFRTPTEYLSRSNITLAQTTLTPAASVKFANNQGVTVQTNSAGGTTTTNPTTGTVTTTNPTTGTVTTTNTTTGTTTTTTPATGTTTTTTTPAVDTGKIALLALLGVLLLRGAVR
jgi:macrodomain Ter protein organizer (MatP/YcbG family)